MEKYISENLGETLIFGSIPCSCIETNDKKEVIITLERGLKGLSSYETVCPHGNNFIVVKSDKKGPFIEPVENIKYSRIWIQS